MKELKIQSLETVSEISRELNVEVIKSSNVIKRCEFKKERSA